MNVPNNRASVILSASVSCMESLCYIKSIESLDQAGIDAYHFDMCDGHFANTLLLSPSILRNFRKVTSRRFDVHLYCTHPSRYLEELGRCGADVVIIQVEAEEDFRCIIHDIIAAGMKPGIGILPGTDIPETIEEILPYLHIIIANTVGPAYSGQPFDQRGLHTMARLRQMMWKARPGIELAADGSVNVERLPALIEAGANHLVCGTSSIFRPGLPLGASFKKFREHINQKIKS